MKSSYCSALLLLCATPAFSAIQTWEWSGTLNLVTTPLQGQFSFGQAFTVRLVVDTAAPLLGGDRSQFRTSTGSYNPVLSATVTVNDWYSADFHSGANPSNRTASITNSMDDQVFMNDQFTMGFFDYQGIVNAPEVNTGTQVFTVNSIEFNFYGPADMIRGTNAAFPTVDAPMVIPGVNFFPEESTNGPYQFIIRFKEGEIAGADMIRGTFNNFAVVPEPSAVAAGLALGAGALVCLRRRKRN